MQKEKIVLSEEFLSELRIELDQLKTVARPANVEAIKEAREQGDLSENADYAAAREEQAYIEARIKEIEYIIHNRVMLGSNYSPPGYGVQIGSTVNIRIDDQKPETYTIVGTLEANPFKNKISNECPIGRALIGLTPGQRIIEVKTGTGRLVKVTLLEVQ